MSSTAWLRRRYCRLEAGARVDVPNWNRLVGLPATRRRSVDLWKRQPVDDIRITRPLFVTGMPRSRSTFLHELLTAANRAPRTWETMFPLAAPGRTPAARGGRFIAHAELQLWWFRRFAPGMDTVHPIRARSPQARSPQARSPQARSPQECISTLLGVQSF